MAGELEEKIALLTVGNFPPPFCVLVSLLKRRDMVHWSLALFSITSIVCIPLNSSLYLGKK